MSDAPTLFDTAKAEPMIENLAVSIWWDYHKATARYSAIRWEDVNEPMRERFRDYARKIIKLEDL